MLLWHIPDFPQTDLFTMDFEILIDTIAIAGASSASSKTKQ